MIYLLLRGLRGLLSSAIETRTLRPSKSLPLRLRIALNAASSSGISTNPKPLERFVILSIMSVAEITSPNALNALFNDSSVVLKLRFPI